MPRAAFCLPPNPPLARVCPPTLCRRPPRRAAIVSMNRDPWADEVDPVLVDTPAALARAQAALAACTIFGLDTETKPLFTKRAAPEPPALLQLAGMRPGAPVPRRVWLFDLQVLLPAHGGALSGALRGVFADPACALLGVGVADDLRDLSHFFGGQCAAFAGPATSVVDLGRLRGDRRQVSARTLAERYAGVRLSKRDRASDWSRRPLHKRQLVYAANDARVALAVFARAGRDAFQDEFDLDLAVQSFWVCRACGREYRTRRRMLAACFESCGLTQQTAAQDSYVKDVHW